MMTLLVPLHSASLFSRGLAAFLTSFFAYVIVGKRFISILRDFKVSQNIRECGPSSHYSKEGTPTMGGLLIIILVTLSCLIWSKLSNRLLLLLLFVLWSYGAIGFYDDYKKMINHSYNGLSALQKYILQSLLAALVIVFLVCLSETMHLVVFKQIFIPYKGFLPYLGGTFGFCVLSYFVLVGSTNAVNLTDGLDGLAIFPVILSAVFFSIVSVAINKFHNHSTDFLLLSSYSSEVLVFCMSLIGAGLGFLWFNAHPAEIFMGDVGSLSLGGVLGALAIIFRQEFIFFILSTIFVSETLSVIFQLSAIKLLKRKIFLMTPFHHHFELMGSPETTVVIRFWIVAIVFFTLALFLFFNS